VHRHVTPAIAFFYFLDHPWSAVHAGKSLVARHQHGL
jgi:hypothetical protein